MEGTPRVWELGSDSGTECVCHLVCRHGLHHCGQRRCLGLTAIPCPACCNLCKGRSLRREPRGWAGVNVHHRFSGETLSDFRFRARGFHCVSQSYCPQTETVEPLLGWGGHLTHTWDITVGCSGLPRPKHNLIGLKILNIITCSGFCNLRERIPQIIPSVCVLY